MAKDLSPDERKWEDELFNTLLKDLIKGQLAEMDMLDWIKDNPTFGAPNE